MGGRRLSCCQAGENLNQVNYGDLCDPFHLCFAKAFTLPSSLCSEGLRGNLTGAFASAEALQKGNEDASMHQANTFWTCFVFRVVYKCIFIQINSPKDRARQWDWWYLAALASEKCSHLQGSSWSNTLFLSLSLWSGASLPSAVPNSF